MDLSHKLAVPLHLYPPTLPKALRAKTEDPINSFFALLRDR